MTCDVDTNRMNHAKNIVDQNYGNKDCSTSKDFRDVLARDDIDAVMISTPDHWHTLMSLMAIRAGIDVVSGDWSEGLNRFYQSVSNGSNLGLNIEEIRLAWSVYLHALNSIK